jgi:antitoxin Phd
MLVRWRTPMPDGSRAEIPSALARFPKWDQQEAKAKFSEVLRRARGKGPQVVTTRGSKPAVIMSVDHYLALTENRPTSFMDLLLPGHDFEPERADMPATSRDFSF